MNPAYIIMGSLALSVIHATIPNHWLPLVVIGRTERWSQRTTLSVTAIAGVAHTASTIIIGLLVGWLGYELSSRRAFIVGIIAPLILMTLGLIYLVMDLRGHGHHHHHDDHHHEPTTPQATSSKTALISALVLAMFFSPCLEIEAYYFTAGALGWFGIAAVSVVYFVVTVLGMLLLVELGRRGMEKLRWHFLEPHEKAVTGAILMVLGILAYILF